MILNHTSCLTAADAAEVNAVAVWGRHLWSDDLPAAGYTGVLAVEIESGGKQPAGPYAEGNPTPAPPLGGGVQGSKGAPWSVESFGLDERQKCQHDVSARLWAIANRCPVAQIRLNRYPTMHANYGLHPTLGIAAIQAMLIDREVMMRGDAAFPKNVYGLSGYAYWQHDLSDSKQLAAMYQEMLFLRAVCTSQKRKPTVYLMDCAERDSSREMPEREAQIRLEAAADIGADVAVFCGEKSRAAAERIKRSALWRLLKNWN